MNNDNLFDFALVNKVTRKKISIKLEDSEGAEVNLKEVITQVMEYVKEQLDSKEANVCAQQVYPLVTQILAGAINDVAGSKQIAALLMTQQLFRYTLIHHMIITFYFLKFIQKNKLNIITLEEEISDDEIENLFKMDSLGSMGLAAMTAGVPIEDIIKALIKSGKVSRSDLINSGMFNESDLKDIPDDEGNN